MNIRGFILGLLLLVTAWALRKSYSRRIFAVQVLLLVILSGATAVGEWVIAGRMRALRAGVHLAIDQLPGTDPSRIAFDALHGYSVAALSIAIIVALITFFFIAARLKSD